MKADAFLFDLDGTLVSTECVWSRALCEMLREDGHDFSEDAAFRIISGRSWNSVYLDVAMTFPDEAIGSVALAEKLWPRYRRLSETVDLRIPGSAEFARRAAAVAPCAIVSGSRRMAIEAVLRRFDLLSYFRLIVGAEDIPVGKPAPDGFLLAAERLGVEPARCVVLEDSVPGVQAGKAAGMTVVALAASGEPDPVVAGLADRVVPSLDDIVLE